MLRAKARQARAMQLRAEGFTFQAIADLCGYSDRANARAAVLKALRDHEAMSAVDLFWLEMYRLERLLAAVWTKATSGDLDAVDRALRIIQTRLRAIGADRLAVHVTTDQGEDSAIRLSDLDLDTLRSLRAIHRTARIADPSEDE